MGCSMRLRAIAGFRLQPQAGFGTGVTLVGQTGKVRTVITILNVGCFNL